jgi:hypothetical protein
VSGSPVCPSSTEADGIVVPVRGFLTVPLVAVYSVGEGTVVVALCGELTTVALRNCVQVGSEHRGDGSTPVALRIFHTVEAPMW